MVSPGLVKGIGPKVIAMEGGRWWLEPAAAAAGSGGGGGTVLEGGSAGVPAADPGHARAAARHANRILNVKNGDLKKGKSHPRPRVGETHKIAGSPACQQIAAKMLKPQLILS